MSDTAQHTVKGGKRASKNIPLTPEQQAEANAGRIVELRGLIDNLEDELSTKTLELSAWVDKTGAEQIGPLKAIKRFGNARLMGEGMTPKEVSYAEEQLMNELPDFCKKSLDTTKMFNAQKTNIQVANALTAKGLSFTQTSTWTFRVVTEK